jgi:hypothetical protein
MKTDWTHLERFRIRNTAFATKTGDPFGLFVFQKGKAQIRAIVSDGNDDIEEIPPDLRAWEHVSVSVKYKNAKGKVCDRCPTWEEMHEIKRIFWEDEECVMQLHPPQSSYVNVNSFTLHLWRPTKATIPTPPVILV